MNFTYKIIKQEDLLESHKIIFAEKLKAQGKVNGRLSEKADRCRLICIVHYDNQPIAIGGIKPKSESVFSSQKANLPEFSKRIDWELGYIYTTPAYTGKGISSEIVRLLLKETANINLMATTEVEENPAMVRILIKNGFQRYGKLWQSKINQNSLGLFLKLNSD